MRCKKCGFDMVAKTIDRAITIWKCPLGHKYTEWKAREATFPDNLEHKAEGDFSNA